MRMYSVDIDFLVSTLSPWDLIFKSPYCLPYNSHDISLENLVLDQLIIPKLIFFYTLVTLPAWYYTDIVGRNYVLSVLEWKG